MTTFEKIIRLYGLENVPDSGYSELEICELESRIGLKLPKILRAYYLTFGRNLNINNNHNLLLQPKDQIGFSEDRYLVFYEENQAVVYWGIKESDLTLDNPKIYGNYDAVNSSQEWFEESPSTEDFLLSMAISNGTLGGLTYNANKMSNKPLGNYLLNFLESNWSEVKDITCQAQRIFTDNFYEVISVSINEQQMPTAIFIGTSNRNRFYNIIDKLNISLDYRSDEDEDEDED